MKKQEVLIRRCIACQTITAFDLDVNEQNAKKMEIEGEKVKILPKYIGLELWRNMSGPCKCKNKNE